MDYSPNCVVDWLGNHANFLVSGETSES
jgi:hypothetical protein